MATITPSKLKIKKNGSSDEYLYSFEDMTGAGSSVAGKRGYVPAPAAGDQAKYLKGDGTWDAPREVPAVTSSDNGKFLRVVSGAWAAVQVPSASGVSF